MLGITKALTGRLRNLSYEEGFTAIGISKARFLEEEATRLEEWLNVGYHGSMSYLERNFDLRTDPRKLVPGAKSVVSLLFNYYNPEALDQVGKPKIAMYAMGEDYHKVLKRKLKRILRSLQTEFGEISGRCFVDSAPVMERDWAKLSGLGWIGKNTLLINKEVGSYYFLAELILDVELEYSLPSRDYCGTCTKCIDACPTQAISPKGYVMDGSKCISYLTIELRKEIPEEFQDKMEDWLFGCDICQHVCPWNRFSTPSNEQAFQPSESILALDWKTWSELTEEGFDEIFHKSPLKRAGFQNLSRNVEYLRKGANHPDP